MPERLIQSAYDLVVLGDWIQGLYMASERLKNGEKVLIVATGSSRIPHRMNKLFADAFSLSERSSDADPVQVISPERRVKIYENEKSFQTELQFQFGNQRPPAWLLNYFGDPKRVANLKEDDDKLRNHILSVLESRGATIVGRSSLNRIFIDRKTFVGVQLHNHSQMVEVKEAFFNTNLDFLKAFCSEDVAMNSEPTGWIFRVHFECNLATIPLGLTSRMVYVDEGAPPLEIFHLGQGRFRLTTVQPMTKNSLNRQEQKRLAQRMLKVCTQFFVDLEYNLKSVSPDLRDPEKALHQDLPKLYPFEELPKIPPELLTYVARSLVTSIKKTQAPEPIASFGITGVRATNEEIQLFD